MSNDIEVAKLENAPDIGGLPVESNKALSLKQFYYDLSPFEDVGRDIMIWIVEKEYYDSTGSIDDRHIDDVVYANLIDTEDFQHHFTECMESAFEPYQPDEKWTRKKVHEYFKTQPNFTYKKIYQ